MLSKSHGPSVDLIGPYGTKKFQAMTMIDPVTHWFEIHKVTDSSSIIAAETLDA